MTKAILFDWHGVLDKTLLAGLFERLSSESKIPVKTIKEKLRDISRIYALGNLQESDFWLFVRNEINIKPSQIKYLKNYINSISLNEELWQYLPKLKKEYTLAILSDCPLEKAVLIRKNVNLGIFDKIFFSAEVHLDKSMPEFFYLAVESLGIKNEEALLVDDSRKNTDFAIQLGMRAHIFTDVKGFSRVKFR